MQLRGYISEKDFLEKYLEDKNRSDIENNLTGEELDEA